MKNFARFIWLYAIDHVMVVLMVVLLATSLLELSFSVSFLNPLARSLSNFSMTDIFYDISKSKAQKERDDLTTLVDMSEVYERGKLADIIEQIESLGPSVLGIDIVFDGERDDSVGNSRLIEVAQKPKAPTVWACKLMDWNRGSARLTVRLWTTGVLGALKLLARSAHGFRRSIRAKQRTRCTGFQRWLRTLRRLAIR